MNKEEYVDAALLVSQIRAWHIVPTLGNYPIAKRPEVLRKDLLTLATGPIRNDTWLTEDEWRDIDGMVERSAHVYMRAIQDTFVHPRLKREFPSHIERSAAEAEATLSQARAALDLLGQLPKGGRRVGDSSQDSPILQKTRLSLLTRIAKLWQETKSEATADELFAALLSFLSGRYSDLAKEALEKFQEYPGTERLRRAILKIHGTIYDTHSTVGKCLRSLIATWSKKTPESQIELLVRLDGATAPRIFQGDLSPLAQELLLVTADKLTRLQTEARRFMDKTTHTIGRDWKIASMDPQGMKVHLQHSIQLVMHDRLSWSDHETSWRRDFERFELLDPSVTLLIELYDIQPASISPHFHHTIRRKQLATV